MKKARRPGRKAVIIGALIILPPLVLLLLNLGRSSERKIERPIVTSYGVGDTEFVRSMGSLLGPGLVPGNRVVALHNGVEIFPAMLEAIRGARVSITFESFIYWSGEVGREFSEALAERARAGIPVHLILDGLGMGKIDQTHLTMMQSAGVQVERYHPLRWYNINRMNNRTHRKILVVDGRVGFTGGVGVADLWLGDADSPEHWRDSHYRVEGPAVAQMQAGFMDNWIQTRAEALHGTRYFPALDSAGPHLGQVFLSSPGTGGESMRLMYLLSIAAARQRLQIANAYFVPDDLLRTMLIEARRRGVEIDIIVPGEAMDAALTRRASRSRWGPMLEAGIRIYEYQPTMFHCKIMIVDGLWVTVGSTNFDNRSFRLNDELNLNVYDSTFARAQAGVFREDLANARLVTLEAWRNRPLSEKVKEWLAGLLRSQV